MMDNPFGLTIVYFIAAVIAVAIFLVVLEVVTKYKAWEGIKKGNIAIAMATGGKIFGVSNIFRFSIEHNDSLYEALVWGAVGFVLLLVAYFIFEFLTPMFKVDDEIENDNRAVGLIAMLISIGLSYVIGASIT